MRETATRVGQREVSPDGRSLGSCVTDIASFIAAPWGPSRTRRSRALLSLPPNRVPEATETTRDRRIAVGPTTRKTPAVSVDCYACEQAGVDAPFRERLVRRGGWRVAHDFNSSLEGWLILAPLRHVHSLDELTPDEATALGQLLRESSIALRSVTGCLKTYVMLFAEAEGFAHLHVHVVPRMRDQPQDRRGPAVFGYLKDGQPVATGRRDTIANALLAAWPA